MRIQHKQRPFGLAVSDCYYVVSVTVNAIGALFKQGVFHAAQNVGKVLAAFYAAVFRCAVMIPQHRCPRNPDFLHCPGEDIKRLLSAGSPCKVSGENNQVRLCVCGGALYQTERFFKPVKFF